MTAFFGWPRRISTVRANSKISSTRRRKKSPLTFPTSPWKISAGLFKHEDGAHRNPVQRGRQRFPLVEFPATTNGAPGRNRDRGRRFDGWHLGKIAGTGATIARAGETQTAALQHCRPTG